MKLTWLNLSWSEWRRRPLRTAVTVAGVAIAVAALHSLLAFHDGYRDGMESEMDRLGAHVLIVPKGCPYDAASMALHGANWPCYLGVSHYQEVRGIPGVAAAAPALMSAPAGPGGAPVVYVGIDDEMRALRTGWRIQGRFPAGPGEILAGAGAARRHGWAIGQRVVLPAVAGAPEGTVAGIIDPLRGSEDDFVYLRLEDAQRWFQKPGQLTHVLVRLRDVERSEQTVTALRGCDAGMDMNVVPLTHLLKTIQSLVGSTRLLLGCVAIIGLLVAAAGVSNAMLMSVSERTREIGVMRAVGASRWDIFRLVWLESVQMCLAGGLVGVLAAHGASWWVEGWLRDRLPFAPADPLIRWEWWVAGACVAGAVALGGLAALLPAARAAELAPMEAMREGVST